MSSVVRPSSRRRLRRGYPGSCCLLCCGLPRRYEIQDRQSLLRPGEGSPPFVTWLRSLSPGAAFGWGRKTGPVLCPRGWSRCDAPGPFRCAPGCCATRSASLRALREVQRTSRLVLWIRLGWCRWPVSRWPFRSGPRPRGPRSTPPTALHYGVPFGQETGRSAEAIATGRPSILRLPIDGRTSAKPDSTLQEAGSFLQGVPTAPFA